MKIHDIIIFSITWLLFSGDICAQKAVICVPIADLIGQQITSLMPNQSAEKSYETLAVCSGEIKSSLGCPRLHQLLYNDVVELIVTAKDEVCIRIPHAYYLIPSSLQPQNNYWTLKKNITLLDDLIKHKIDTMHIPPSIDFAQTNHDALKNPDIVTLVEPHYDSTTKFTFSVGTRFVKTTSTRKRRASLLEVFAFDYGRNKEVLIKIPLQKCVVHNLTKTAEERMADFVALIKKWTHQKNGFIAYVWGGTSFTAAMHGNFKEVMRTGDQGDYSLYEYEKDMQSPKSGFDCSGVILRAAQICGIPYFCKNTTTIAQCLTPLTKEQTLQSGDLILIKGHVMIVSDLDKNLLIEARSYGHGYGKLQEIPLPEVFEGIETYKDLCDACFEKKVVKRKDIKGSIRDTFANVQLFSMRTLK